MSEPSAPTPPPPLPSPPTPPPCHLRLLANPPRQSCSPSFSPILFAKLLANPLRQLRIAVSTAGPQPPGASDRSEHRWTSNARVEHSEPRCTSTPSPIAVSTARLQPPNTMPQYLTDTMSDKMVQHMSGYMRNRMPKYMPKCMRDYMSDIMECQKIFSKKLRKCVAKITLEYASDNI